MANQQVRSGATGNGERSGSIPAKSHEAAEQMKGAVISQAEEARERAASAKEHAAERIRRVATQLRNVGEALQADDELAARVAQRASSSVERVAGYVGSADLRGLVNDTERFARTQPALFFGGAFLFGLAIGRFFKGSGDGGSARRREFAAHEGELGRMEHQEWRSEPERARERSYRESYRESGFGSSGAVRPGAAPMPSPAVPSSPLSGSATPGSVTQGGEIPSAPGSGSYSSSTLPSATPGPDHPSPGSKMGSGEGSKKGNEP